MNSLLGRIATWPKRRWVAAGGCLSVVVGATVGSAVYGLPGQNGAARAVVAGILGAFLALWLTFVTCLQLRQRRRAQETRALINVRPLTGRLPLDLGGWAADPVFADELMRTLCRRRPAQVVECGSGWTTVLVACCLEELDAGRIVALEHKERFARRTRELVAACGCANRAEVRLAPLSSQNVDGDDRVWYDASVVQSIAGPIDLLLVDGPPGSLAQEVRFPAVPLLRGRLANDCLVLLDDGYRGDEARIARAWGRLLKVEPILEARGGGFWVLDRDDDDQNDLRGELHAS